MQAKATLPALRSTRSDVVCLNSLSSTSSKRGAPRESGLYAALPLLYPPVILKGPAQRRRTCFSLQYTSLGECNADRRSSKVIRFPLRRTIFLALLLSIPAAAQYAHPFQDPNLP